MPGFLFARLHRSPGTGRVRRRYKRVAAAGVAAAVVAGVSATNFTPAAVLTPAAPAAAAALCGDKPSVVPTKVMVIWEENHSFSNIMGDAQAPYINNTIAKKCGLATDYHAPAAGSLGNYLRGTSGFGGIPTGTGCSTSSRKCQADYNNIFHQETVAGQSWRSYAESMPSNCFPDAQFNSTGHYMVRHNPAPYYADIHADCQKYNVPTGKPGAGPLHDAVAAGRLPDYSSVTPNGDDDMHDSGVAKGDVWLSKWIPEITSGPDYQTGRLAIFIVWDESFSADQHIPAFVLSQATPAGKRSAGAFDHFGLLRTSEEITHVPLLPKAKAALSMLKAFNLDGTPGATPTATPTPRPTSTPSPTSTPRPTATPTPTPSPSPGGGGIQISHLVFAPGTGPILETIAFDVSKSGHIAVAVLNANGAIVRHKVDDKAVVKGPVNVNYWGYNDAGVLVPPGRYIVVVVATDSAGNLTEATGSITIK